MFTVGFRNKRRGDNFSPIPHILSRLVSLVVLDKNGELISIPIER